MKRNKIAAGLTAALLLGILTGCGGGGSAGTSAADGPAQDTDTVVIAMDPNSEPAAGFDPAFGWGPESTSTSPSSSPPSPSPTRT